MAVPSVGGRVPARRRARTQVARVTAAALVVGLGAMVVPNAPSDASSNATRRATALRQHRRTFTAKQLHNRPERSTKVLTYVVTLRDEPGAVVAGRAAEDGLSFSRAARVAADARAVAAASRVSSALASKKIAVTRRYSHTVNGFAVRTDLSGAARIRALADVASVTATHKVQLDNANSNAFTGVPQAWDATGFTGAGQKIAVIDTGLDYTHADLGGSGDPADFENNDGTVIEPGSFPTAKVIGGYDFVGDDYDADTPAPDADPLDCNGHGSHVAGTAAGSGVLADGSTYHGPYTSAAMASHTFKVAPGAAPNAKLLAYRVFGCDGSANTDVIVAAIDQAVADGATVINMSLGSVYGRVDDPDSMAADAASLAGTMVVTSAGNEGASPYMVGGPAAASRVLAVGAVDAEASFPGATIDPSGANVTAINANGSTALPVTAPLHVVSDGNGGVSLGCTSDDYDAATAGTIAVIARGVCARVDKPAAAQAAGAVGVIMLNNATNLPPFEGNIAGVTIPFLGVDPSDAGALDALEGDTITLVSAGVIQNPAYSQSAPFSSGGPRSADGAFKPEVSAPGVGVFSVAVGSGTEAASISGTSMASPHTAGVAALVRQAHPSWGPRLVKAAIVGTADRAKIDGFQSLQAGNGAVSTLAAVKARQVITGTGGDVAANFFWRQHLGGYSASSSLMIYNSDNVARTYNLSRTFDAASYGAVVTVSPSTVTVPAHGQAPVTVKYSLSAAAAAAVPVPDVAELTVITGSVVATPTNGGTPLHIAFQAVPRPRSSVTSQKSGNTVTVRNGGLITGTADVYSWVLADGADPDNRADARALGVQYLDPGDGSGDVIGVLAYSVASHLSNPAEAVYDSYFDTTGDGNPDYEVFGADDGLILADDPNGFLDTFVVNLATGDGFIYDAYDPTDGSIAELSFFVSDLGIHAGDAPALFVASTQDLEEGGSIDDFDGVASFAPFDPQTTQGEYIPLAPGESASFHVARRGLRHGEVRALGWMVVTVDDLAKGPQADLLAG